jgi:hypothetical protein
MSRQIIPKIIPCIFAVLLAGCAGTPRPATQIVEVPVFTPCVKTVPARPDYEFAKLSLDAADGEKVLALARDWPRAMKYGGDLEAVIAGCR